MNLSMHFIGCFTLLVLISLPTDSSGTNKQNIVKPLSFHVENLCEVLEEPQVFLQPWTVATFQFGFLKDDSKKKRVNKCKIRIKTYENFGIACAIEGMKITGTPGKCSDFIQFISYGQTFIQRVFGKLDINSLSQAKSDELCGKTSLKGSLSSSKEIIDQGKNANSFYNLKHIVFLVYHQSKGQALYNDSFTVLVTVLGEQPGPCKDMHMCRESPMMCIHPNLTCDGHVNCAIPNSGSDEIGCDSNNEENGYNPIAVTMIVLSALVAIVLGVCILVTIICQFRKKPLPGSRYPEEHIPRRREELNVSTNNDAPCYESVILNDSAPPKICDLPPSYDDIYPKGEVTSS